MNFTINGRETTLKEKKIAVIITSDPFSQLKGFDTDVEHSIFYDSRHITISLTMNSGKIVFTNDSSFNAENFHSELCSIKSAALTQIFQKANEGKFVINKAEPKSLLDQNLIYKDIIIPKGYQIRFDKIGGQIISKTICYQFQELRKISSTSTSYYEDTTPRPDIIEAMEFDYSEGRLNLSLIAGTFQRKNIQEYCTNIQMVKVNDGNYILILYNGYKPFMFIVSEYTESVDNFIHRKKNTALEKFIYFLPNVTYF